MSPCCQEAHALLPGGCGEAAASNVLPSFCVRGQDALLEHFIFRADRFSSPATVNLDIRGLQVRQNFWLGNENLCCGSCLCVQLYVEQPSPAQGPVLDASLINPHPLPAPLCLHQRAAFLMPRTGAANSPPKDFQGLCQIFNCIFLANSHSLILQKRS